MAVRRDEGPLSMGEPPERPGTRRQAATGARRERYPCRRCGAGFRFQHELDKHDREQHATPV